jgi:hypothetical protein
MSETTFLKRRHSNGHEVYEKVFKITNPQGDATLLQSEGYYKRTKDNIGKYLEGKNSLCTVGGNVNYYNHYGKQYGGS